VYILFQRISKLTAIVVVLVMSISMFSTTYAQESGSSSKIHWAQEKMQRWFERGIIEGDGSGDLKHDEKISRAEVATIINKVFGFNSKASKQFEDVNENSWYADELLKARAAGYLKGYNGNIAKAESKITREDVAVIISNVFEFHTASINNYSLLFKDKESISVYALSAVNKLSSDGVIKGYKDGNFKPKSNITRAEFISIMDNLVKLLCNSSGTYNNENVSGHAVISHPSVNIEDVTVDGNLYITEGIGNSGVNLNNITVTDLCYISGGSNNIKIIDTKLNLLIVNCKNLIENLTISGKSNISKFILNSPVQISVDESTELVLEVNSDKVVINGQTIIKGVAIVEKGIVKQNVEENVNEIPAVVPSNSPISTPTPTSTISSSHSNKKRSSNSSKGNRTTTPVSTPTTTVTVSPTATMNIMPTSTVTKMPTSTVTMTPTSTITIMPTPTVTMTPTATMNIMPTPTVTMTPTPTLAITPTTTVTMTPIPTVVVEPTVTAISSPTTSIVSVPVLEDITVEIGNVPELPLTVIATYNDGSTKEETVVWPSVDTSSVGEQEVEGTITGTSFIVPVKIIVISNELRLLSATADNLKEVVLKFNKPLLDEKEATNTNNYDIDDDLRVKDYFSNNNIVSNVDLSKDKKSVILLLEDEIDQHSDIKLTIKSKIGLSEDTIVSLKNVKDITIPTIYKVEVLGNSVLKVTFSEPLQYATTLSNYTIDGKYFGSSQPALSSDDKTVQFDLVKPLLPGIHKLAVTDMVRDYASLHIEDNEVEFTVLEDTIAPSGVVESATQAEVIIKFNEKVKCIEFDHINNDIGASIDDIDLADDDRTLKINFDVDDAIPETGGLITINNLTDYSGNSVDFKIDVVPDCDKIRPEYVGYTICDYQELIVLEFSEDVFEQAKFKLIDKDNNEVAVIILGYYYNEKNNEYERNKLVLAREDRSNFESEEYNLIITKVMDFTPLKNEILETVVNVYVCDQISPAVKSVLKDSGKNEIYVEFSEKVDKTTAVNKENYIYTLDNYLIDYLDSNTDVTLLPDEQTVCIRFQTDGDSDGINSIDVDNIVCFQVENISDLVGNTMILNSFSADSFKTIGEQPEYVNKLDRLPTYSDIYADYNNNKIYIMFNQKVNKSIAESRTSYIFKINDCTYRSLNEYTTANLLSDGKTVCIQFPIDDGNVDEDNWIDVYDIDIFQINNAVDLTGKKVPVHVVTYFSDIISSPGVVSADVISKNKILVKLDDSIDESTLKPDDFIIRTEQDTWITAWDAEYDSENMEITLSVNANIKSDGTSDGVIRVSLDDDYDIDTTNIFGQRLRMYSRDILLGDSFSPYVYESVTDAVYEYGQTELYVDLSENLAIIDGEVLDSNDLGQFTVKVDGVQVEAPIFYYDGELYDYDWIDVNEYFAKFMILLDGNCVDKEIQVIFTPSDPATIVDNAGNRLESFNITWSKK